MTNAVAIAQQGSNNTTFRNKIINGTMVIDQRNQGASVTPTTSGTYTLDRWQGQCSQNSKYTVQQNAGSVTPPAGFTSYLGCTSSSAYSIGATDYFFVQQVIEGYNMADLAWGTANAKTITISFWVRSSLTGTFGGCLQNAGASYNYPFTYTISSANTWEQKSVTITGPTSGTWNTANNAGMFVIFGLGVGSTYSGTAGAWTSTVYIGATGATSVVGTSGATLYFTGVQLEAGSAASPFENRLFSVELALCQRYACQYPNWNNLTANISLYTSSSGSNVIGGYTFPVPMRAAPGVINLLGSTNNGTYYIEGTGNEMFRAGATGTSAGTMNYTICALFTAEL